ncbi:MAG: hypothetical protein GY814_14580, partial [Gammaproteobacteria bacterium]|nr:hypothetical protein [Gammaproteobacteria bacterium]
MLPATFKARSKSTDAKSTADKNRLLAKLLIAGSIFLLPMGNAFAAADLSTSSAAFVSADPARTNSYMDAGGVWNGLTEVSNVGDTFTLTIANTAGGSIALDSAFDLQDVIVTVAAGFNLASNALNINNVTGGACPDISVGTAQQTGTQITLNIGNNEDVRPGCTYELSFGMTTTNTVAGGSHPLSYSISYDDDGGNPQTIPVAQNIDVNTGALSVSKTTATVTAVATDVITYDVTVTSTGAGGLFDVQLNDVLSADLNGLTFNVPIPPPGSVLGNNYTFEYLAAGEVVNLTIDATVTPVSVCPVLENTANLSERRAIATDTAGPVAVQFDFQFTSGPLSNAISHAATSYCEFCGDGVVSITVQNPTNAQLTNISLLEDLQGSGLEYIPGTTTINAVPAANPGIAGLSNELLTWNLPDLAGSGNHVISFGVRSTNAEALNTAVRDVIATVDFDMSCLAATQSVDTGQFELPIRQPIPTVFKDGRNYDAGQTIGSAFTDPVYGSFNDDVIWQVNVANAGLANMEALLMNDSIDGNFSINFICPTEGDAEAIAIANGVGPGATSCIPFNSSYNVVDPFGNIADPDDVAATSNVSLYYVGRILNLNTDNVNTADISWGCAVDSPTGGSITAPASTGGVTPGVTILETGDLSTDVLPADLVITQTVTGSNPGQPLGSKGLMTITLENQTGGSIQGLTVATDLPAGYVMDNSYGPVNGQPFGQPTNVTTPIYGVYPGFIDTFTRDDLELITLDPLDDLNPTFTLTSTTFGADLPQQQDMLRHGDIISFTFGIVMIEAARFDLVADLDVAPENTADGTDPTNAVALTNTVVVNFDAVDSTGPQGQSENQPFGYNSNPEDLDVSISDQLFILTNNPGTPLDLNVLLTNNGGHDADDYTAYVAFGQAMTVQTIPAGCGVGPVANPPPHPHWNDPVAISALAFVYACDRGAIAPGVTETITFAVVKAAGAVADDLTFRADVVGEVTQFDGTALTFPTPPTIPDTTPNVAQLANNYSFDAIRSRVLGFNLVKSAWYCAEDGLLEPAPPADILSATPGAPNIPTLTGNLNSQIGEDCTYRIETGGWFGFVTPGFALIEVQNVTVTDDLPNNLGDGQGYIEFGGTPFNYTSTGGIQLNGPNGGAGTTPLDGTDIAWNFNTASGIAVADEFFRVDFKTRLLNNPVDLAYPVPGGYAPNLHGNLSTNIARSSFTAVFQSAPIGGVVQPLINIDVSDTLSNPAGYIVPPGYPAESQRRVDLTEVEPNLIVTKQVCNESLNGFGPGCNGGTFADSVNDGDTNDSYIYRVTLTNEVTAPVRSPAFNVIATDTLDSSDLMEVVDFSSDGLDNDGDLTIDEADEADLFASIPDNILGNGTEAVITVDETFNNLLLQVDSGDTIT